MYSDEISLKRKGGGGVRRHNLGCAYGLRGVRINGCMIIAALVTRDKYVN